MDVDALRAVTPGCLNRVHLNNAGAALSAQPTLDAMTGHLRLGPRSAGMKRPRCAIVTAKVDGMPAVDVAAALGAAGVNVTTTVPEHTQFDTEDRNVHPLVRLSPRYYNTEDELERAVDLIATICAPRPHHSCRHRADARAQRQVRGLR
ncbi:MAG: hypothetical protein ACT4NP_05090 [Pseudonocardiales bacterium]